MAKREKITPPEITEELLREVESLFCERKAHDHVWQALFTNTATKQRYMAIGKALIKLRDAWGELSAEEREWFFMSVNAPKKATKLLLGEPDNDPFYDMEKQPHEVMAKLEDACAGYDEYREVAGYKGNRRVYRHKAVVGFLMGHWEKETGKPATFYRSNTKASGEPVGVAKWVQQCLLKLEERGVKGLEPANAENRVEKVYKNRAKPSGKNKAPN